MDDSAWDERYLAADRLWSAEPNLFVADRLGPVDPGTGLDLASGEGRNAIWLSELGWDMTAVDFSEVAVERGRYSTDAVRFEVADIFDWAPDRRFDLVLIAYLQLREPELQEIVKRATTWLEYDGELFMIGHDHSNLDDGCGGPPIAEILWDIDTMRPWLDGLRLVEAGVVRRPVETEDGVVFARDALIRARGTLQTEHD